MVSLNRATLDKVRRHLLQRTDQALALTVKRLGPLPRSAPWDGNPRIALLTVNFSTTRYLKLMLLTLTEQQDLDLVSRVVIRDNGSMDHPEPFLTQLEAKTGGKVVVTSSTKPGSHALGMRRALSALRKAERHAEQPANILLFCDTDIVFRNPGTIRALADRFRDGEVAFVGELRQGLFPYQEAQASFLAVRRDWAERRSIAPWVDHGSPAYWLQKSIWKQGGTGAPFPSNDGGYILHRGRAGVAAAQTFFRRHHLRDVPYNRAHYMGVANGPQIWQQIDDRWKPLLDAEDPTAVAQTIARSMAPG